MFRNMHQLEAVSITGSAYASSLFITKIRIADQANHGPFLKPQGRSPRDGRPLLSKGIADVINTNKTLLQEQTKRSLKDTTIEAGNG